jgi:hypothetical protein
MPRTARPLIAAFALIAVLCGSAPAGAADAPGSKPGDEAMTCQQIATELSPYVQQMVPNIQALGSSNQQLLGQARDMQKKRELENQALTPLATAGAMDPTGAAKRAYAAALTEQMAKEKAENEAFQNSALAKENRQQSDKLVAQGKQMESNDRLQRLMQLGREKHCDKK